MDLFGIGEAVGGLLGYSSAKKANDMNRDMSRETREWMTDQSNTAHQRQVMDMRAAGLNPILSATGGKGAASMSASPGNAMIPESLQGLTSALAVNRQKEEIKTLKEQRRGISADSDVKEIVAKQTAYKDWDVTKDLDDEGNPRSVRRWISQWEHESRAAVAEAKNKIQTQETNVAIRKLEELLKRAEIPGAEAQAEFWKSVGDYLPYLKVLASGVAGVAGIAAAAKKVLSKAPDFRRTTNIYNTIKPWGGAGSSARSRSP